MKLIPEQIDHYRQNGYVVVKKLIPPLECQEFVHHAEALSRGNKSIMGFHPKNNYSRRVFNLHLYDPLTLRYLIHPNLKKTFGELPRSTSCRHSNNALFPWL